MAPQHRIFNIFSTWQIQSPFGPNTKARAEARKRVPMSRRHHRDPSPLPRRRDHPPGNWQPHSPRTPRHRDRSRSRRRHVQSPSYHSSAATRNPNPRQLIADMGTEEFAKHTLQCIQLLTPADFESIWHNIPFELQRAAYSVPPGIRTDIDNIKDEVERKTMCRRINELRRERCVLLSSPSQRERWQDESWTMTPMSRETCRRFWEIFALFLWHPQTQ